MIKCKTLFLLSTCLFIATAPAHADTVIKEVTTITPEKVKGANMVDMSVFDQNKDGVLSMQEVGEKLFEMFDQDGNEVIDNIEYKTNSVMTIAPMEMNTLTFVDYAGDGTVDRTEYTHDEFLKASQLTRFAGDLDGLSPEDLMKKPFAELDDNNDKVIDRQEWKEAYSGLVKLPHEEPERYNN